MPVVEVSCQGVCFCLSKTLFVGFGDKKSGGNKHVARTHKLSRAVDVENKGNYAYL